MHQSNQPTYLPVLFTIKVNIACSEPKTSQVPQGSVAGPTFYLEYAFPSKTVADNHFKKING
jgi:hypothetical protein